jgi:hypothetical protein
VTRSRLYSNGNPQPEHLEPAVVEQLPTLIGRDPRQMTVAELNALGHEKTPLLRVIRTNCIECVGGSEAEVRRCRMWWCPFWPYRMASNPFAAPKTEAQLEAFRNRHAAVPEARSLKAEIPEGPRHAWTGPRHDFVRKTVPRTPAHPNERNRTSKKDHATGRMVPDMVKSLPPDVRKRMPPPKKSPARPRGGG